MGQTGETAENMFIFRCVFIIFVKQTGILHGPVVVHHLTHGMYGFGLLASLSTMFIRNWIKPMVQWAKCERSY